MIDIDWVGVQELDGVAQLFPALHEGGNGSDIIGGIKELLQRCDVPGSPDPATPRGRRGVARGRSPRPTGGDVVVVVAGGQGRSCEEDKE